MDLDAAPHQEARQPEAVPPASCVTTTRAIGLAAAALRASIVSSSAVRAGPFGSTVYFVCLREPGTWTATTHFFELGANAPISACYRNPEALLRAAQEGAISLPRVVVDFSGADLPKKVRDISSLDAPHRVFDAILRDALLGATPFSRCSTPSVRKRRSPSACAQRSASNWSRRRSSPVPRRMSSCSSSAPSRSRARRSPSSSIAWGSPAPFATRSRRDWGQTPRFF
jgi:hypothetical protein